MSASRWTTAKRRKSPRLSRRFGLIELLEGRNMLVGEFTDLGNLGLDGVIRGTAAWGDYDNDGDLDVLLTGFGNSPNTLAKVYRNVSGSYVDISATLVQVNNSSVAWGDYDNDGDLDILLTGRDAALNNIAKVYRNDGGNFIDISAPLTGVRYSSTAWGDYDNDGDLDILITGRNSTTNSSNLTKIYRNNGSDSFVDISASLPGVSFGSAVFGDYDNDGDLDILISGTGTTGTRLTSVYRNDGGGSFTDISAGLLQLNNSSHAWGDYDNDGDLDILISGQQGSGQLISLIYRNNGNETFTNINAPLEAVFYGSVAWGDYDNDGDLDAILTGRTAAPTTNITRIYRNDSGTLVDISTDVTGMDLTSLAWGDYDNDGDLDILLAGRDGNNNFITRVFRNNATAANTAPSAPTGLTSTVVSGTSVTFAWTAATDTQTPSLGLNYNLRVGTTLGGSDVFSTMANTTSGRRRVPDAGPIQGTSYTLQGLTPGATYYWSVQAIDTSFAGGTFTTEQSFVAATPPTVILPTVTNVTANSATLGGTVTADGGATITERGTLLAKTSVNNNPQLNGNGVTKLTATGMTGVFTVDAMNLDPETGYSYVAFATNAVGTTYTTVDAFTTAAVPPTIGGTVSDITPTSAVFAGTITAGSSPATEFGYVFAKTTDDATPQIGEANVIQTLRLGGIVLGGSFGEVRTGLLPDTQYTFAVYAIYPGGTLYGNYITFTTSADPSITSPTATNITSNSATLGGNVIAAGNTPITERGILLAKTSVNNNPQLNGNGVTKLTATGTTGVFTGDAMGLDFTTGYSYVAFATNSSGTTYTAVETFTTLATLAALDLPIAVNLQATSAVVGGSLPNTGGSTVTEFGYLYAKTADDPTPQIGEANVTSVAAITFPINVNASFTRPLSGLEPATQYSLTTYAINSIGTSYSNTTTFTTLAAPPTVTTPTATDVTANSATLGGNVTADNGAAITERGILLAKTSVNNAPQLNGPNVIKITATGTTGVFTVDALGLDPVTGYSYVAFATNAIGTTYTTVETFSTIGLSPTVTAPTATNVTLTTATLGGNVTDDGQATIIERGIVWSETSLNNNPQIGGASVIKVTAPGTTGVFTIDVTALPTGAQISYAAYATNAVGTTYTTVGTFTTQPAIGQFPGITVQILNGQMIVTGTAQDDTIKIASNNSGGYLVTANKPINGLASPQTFSGASSITANTLGGHDDLWLAAPLTLDSVTVDLGAGNDRLVLGVDPNNPINNNTSHPQFGTQGYLTVNGALQVTGGEGDDRVIERTTSITGTKTINLGEGNNEYNLYWSISNATNLTSGAGNDRILLGYLVAQQAVTFNTGAGNDLVSSYASRFSKTSFFNTGAGLDTVGLDVNIYDDALTVDTGSESDFLLFARSIAAKSVSLLTGTGNDSALLGKYITGYDANGSTLYSNGGSRVDQLTLQTGAGADIVQVAANAIRLFYADLGDSYDDADVDYNSFTDGLLDGGLQGTRLRLRGNANFRYKNV